jgi:hypothetical protein
MYAGNINWWSDAQGISRWYWVRTVYTKNKKHAPPSVSLRMTGFVLLNLVVQIQSQPTLYLSAFKDSPSSFSARPTDDLLSGIFVVN